MTSTIPSNLPVLLARRLARPLPGRSAQSEFEPELAYGRHFDEPWHGARPAAVLALLYPSAGEWVVPLTLRPDFMLSHAAQVCFPGGIVEPGESEVLAALRECEEELGVPASGVQILGPLSKVNLFVSNFHIRPFVGWLPDRPALQPNAAEVGEVLELPAAALVDGAIRETHQVQRGQLRFQAPHLEWQGHRIWGATALILGELSQLLREVGES